MQLCVDFFVILQCNKNQGPVAVILWNKKRKVLQKFTINAKLLRYISNNIVELPKRALRFEDKIITIWHIIDRLQNR